MPKRIIAEKYLEDSTGELRDYKFFCFNGQPTYLQCDIGRITNHYRSYYDMDYKFIPVRDDCPSREDALNCEKSILDEMKEVAKELAQPFQFVRVDFYEVFGKIYFGEMTYFHNGGITWFEPKEYDQIFGENWKLIKK